MTSPKPAALRYTTICEIMPGLIAAASVVEAPDTFFPTTDTSNLPTYVRDPMKEFECRQADM